MKKVWKKLFCAGITVFGGTALFLRMIGETQWLTLGDGVFGCSCDMD